jgi:hypothetical protein
MRTRTTLVVCPVVACVAAVFGSGPPALAGQQPAAPTVVASEWSAAGSVARVSCPNGTQLVGGGFDSRLQVNMVGQVDDGVELSAPDPATPNGWQAQAHHGQARAFAMCTAQAPTPVVVASEWGAQGAVARVTCPAGTQLVGGGVDSRLVANLASTVLDDIEANAPDPELANTWKAQAHHGQARAFAMCTAEAPTPVVVASEWGAQGSVARATCPAGTQLVGGGQDARLTTNVFDQVTDAVELNAPDPGTPNTWQVQLHSGQARAFAMCTP